MNAYLQKLFEKHKVSEKDKHEILQIYTFLPDEKKQNFRQEFKIPLLPTLGIVGRLSEEKGHLKLLEILKILIEKHRQKVQLLIYCR